MPSYLVRVQLDGQPSSETYQALHDLMFGMGLKLSINLATDTQDPTIYALPHATYYGENIVGTAAEVRNRVRGSVQSQVWKPLEIMVVEAGAIAVWAKPWKP